MGFFWCKVHTLAVCVMTAAIGVLVDRGVPYFPIELSRTACGPQSRFVFKWGAASVLPTLCWSVFQQHHKRDDSSLFAWLLLHSPLPIWVCFMVVAVYEDENHLFIHNGAVLGILCVVAGHSLLGGDAQRRWPVMFCGLLLLGVSVAMKAIVIVYTEHEVALSDWWVWWRVLLNAEGFRTRVVDHTMDVMFREEVARVPHLSLPIFRVTGVLQWLALYVFTTLY
jgi:hypothetical protein